MGQGLILRVQDEMGRGPWKPGTSEKWIDPDRTGGPPAVWQELENFQMEVQKWHRLGYHVGCAVRGMEGIRHWFTKTELSRLRDLRYDIYDASKARIIFESRNQLMVGTKHALRKLPKAMIWDPLISSYEPGDIWSD